MLAHLHGGGDVNHPKVLAEYQEIEEALRFEREEAVSSFKALVAPRMLKRVILGMSIQMWSQLCGMNIMMYYSEFYGSIACLKRGLISCFSRLHHGGRRCRLAPPYRLHPVHYQRGPDPPRHPLPRPLRSSSRAARRLCLHDDLALHLRCRPGCLRPAQPSHRPYPRRHLLGALGQPVCIQGRHRLLLPLRRLFRHHLGPDLLGKSIHTLFEHNPILILTCRRPTPLKSTRPRSAPRPSPSQPPPTGPGTAPSPSPFPRFSGPSTGRCEFPLFPHKTSPQSNGCVFTGT